MNTVDESLKIVWAYMLEKGKLTNGRWSFHGGDWEGVGSSWDCLVDKEANEKFLAKVKKVGVNWFQTVLPLFEIRSEFTDTFNDPEDKNTLLGTIYLNDGGIFTIGVGDASKHIVHYIDMMDTLDKDRQRVNDIFGE